MFGNIKRNSRIE